jgi:hypothetical protein
MMNDDRNDKDGEDDGGLNDERSEENGPDEDGFDADRAGPQDSEQQRFEQQSLEQQSLEQQSLEQQSFEQQSSEPRSSEQQRTADSTEPKLEPYNAKKRPRISLLSLLALTTTTLVLGALLIPGFIRARARGSLTACKSNLKNIGTALEMYSTDWSGKYPGSLEALTPNYLKTIPECPSAGSMTYRVHFGVGAPMNSAGYEDYYYIECYGENHKQVSVTGNYPAYNGIQGLVERAP